MQSSLDLHTSAPHPESRLRLVDSGLEITVRYPVEIRRAVEIEDRITTKVIQQVENDPSGPQYSIDTSVPAKIS